jgi:cytidylate kinase
LRSALSCHVIRITALKAAVSDKEDGDRTAGMLTPCAMATASDTATGEQSATPVSHQERGVNNMSPPNHGTSIEQLIEQQMRRWELARRRQAQQERPGRGKLGRVYFGPYVLVSRDKGAGGRETAKLIGQRLGWQVFDRQIVDAIAERTKMRQQLIESLDERTRGGLEEFLRHVLTKEIGSTDYLLHLRQVLLALGQQGDVVIVGRGAEYVLPAQFGLRARMVAPLNVRVERIAKAEGLSPESAEALVRKVDQERKVFIRSHFQHDARNPLHYDLVVNTGGLSVEGTAEIVLAAARQKLGVAQASASAT